MARGAVGVQISPNTALQGLGLIRRAHQCGHLVGPNQGLREIARRRPGIELREEGHPLTGPSIELGGIETCGPAIDRRVTRQALIATRKMPDLGD